MAPNPKCSALAAAINRKGLTYAQLANQIGSNEARVTQIITGDAAPTDAEFKALAAALGVSDVPHVGVHSTS